MKKLKVILPAILTLAVSTSAAVTGTVAWFTATRLRTVQMNNITAVNPEEGLNLVSITSLTNVVGTNLEDDGTLTDPTVTPIIKQATYMAGNPETETPGYLRDASVDVNAGKVYKAVLSEDGSTVTGFAEQAIGTADTKTYNGKSIFYATSFTLNFNIARSDSGYQQHLFLDLNASDVTEADADTAAAKNEDIYHGLRIGFKTTSNWFVWAPFTETAAGTTAKYVNAAGTTIDDPNDDDDTPWASINEGYATHTDSNFVAGNNTSTTTSSEIRDDSTPLAVGKKTTANGWLGQLAVDNAVTAVTVYTWFEGTEPDVISDNFTEAITGLTANLRFIMRRVANPQP